MSRHKKRRKKKLKAPGLPPGSMIYTGDKIEGEPTITHCRYNADVLEISDEVFSPDVSLDSSYNNWIDIRGLHHIDLIKSLGANFDIHPLILEDIVNVNQRPKYEAYDSGYFITLKAMSFDNNGNLDVQQMSLYFNNRFLISFQENQDDYFSAIRTRMENVNGRIRNNGINYLVYCLIDLICDQYFVILGHLDESIIEIELKMMERFEKNAKVDLHHLRVYILDLKKKIFPVRDIVLKFTKMTEEQSEKETLAYYKDLFDHIIHIHESLEMARANIDSLSDVYNTQIGLMNNDIIQTLTIISTIFIPITFIAGIYGMNFAVMPELEWENGYWYALGLMLLIIIGMLFYFKKQRWI